MESKSKQRLPQFHSKPVKCLSPAKVLVPRLNLKPALLAQDFLSTTESLRSAATTRMSLQNFSDYPSFSSPRIVRASHDLTLPCLTSRDSQRRKLKTRPQVVLIGRHRRPVCANLLIDQIDR